MLNQLSDARTDGTMQQANSDRGKEGKKGGRYELSYLVV